MEEDKKVIAHYFGYSNYKTFAEDEQIKKSMGTLSKSIVNIINELERLQKEFEAVDHECSRLEQKEIELENKNCLHCGKDTPLYCEKCYQELISKNAELQMRYVENSTNEDTEIWKDIKRI